MFLNMILNFIKELRLKDPSIPNMLVELTAECLFDLATSPRPDVFQRHEILHCLNMVCAESSTEIRFATRTKFGEYFVKIASQMAVSGFLPAQYAALECLLRWLVPRQEPSLRAAAAARWLPDSLCPQAAKDLFLNSNWLNFFQDARDFLNALNEGNGLVKSVVCRRLCIGEVVIINGTEKQQSWLDFNTSWRSVSVLLDPRVLEVFGVKEHRACEMLYVDHENTETALLHRESLGLTISLHTHGPPRLRPSALRPGPGRLTAVLSSRTDLRRVDEAMRNTFGDKYQKKTKASAKAIVKTDSDSDDTNDTNLKPSRKDSYEAHNKIPSITTLNITSSVKSASSKRKTTITDIEVRPDRKTKSVTKKSVSKESPVKTIEKSKATISPIKLNSSNIENSSDDECIKKIRSMFSKVNSQKSNKINESMKRKPTSPILRERKKRREIPNVDTDIFYAPERNESKKIEVLEDIVISESGPSISSVNDWFRKAVPTSRRDNTCMSYKDTIQNVMEKLDTTLVEINQNTSKKFVNLFVEAQRQLPEQKDEYRQLYKKVASDLISEMVRVMDDKFAELDRKSQEMGTSFMEKLKQQAFDLIRDDCKQKRDMVLLLKEDVQAVMDHIEEKQKH